MYVKIPPGKGCGFVQFVHRQQAEQAIAQLNNQVLGKQPVRSAPMAPSQAVHSPPVLPELRLLRKARRALRKRMPAALAMPVRAARCALRCVVIFDLRGADARHRCG